MVADDRIVARTSDWSSAASLGRHPPQSEPAPQAAAMVVRSEHPARIARATTCSGTARHKQAYTSGHLASAQPGKAVGQ